MKILVITHSFGQNGAAELLKSAMRHWSQSLGWEVEVFVDDKNFTEHGSELSSIGVRLIKDTSIKTDYQLVLINTFTDIQYANLFLGKIPTALWVHEGASVIHHFPARPLDLIKLLSTPSLLIFQTQWQSRDVFRSFIYHLPKEKIVIVPNGVEVATHKITIKKSTSPIHNIINIGSLSPLKRQFDLVAAVMNLSKKYPTHCRFIGNLEYKYLFSDAERRYLTDYPDVLCWDGSTNHENTMQALSESDIFCSTSSDESFGLAPIEAALLNVPVVITDLPVYNEIGWVDGINCLKFPVGDVAALERAIEKLILDRGLREKLAAHAYRLAKTFSHEKFLSNLTHALLSAASLKISTQDS